ncbi:hypothetical protein [Streptomyces sp. NPDC047042]|uniref:hypothetical protein n=1 Tax=Streptomyces sp. NPDC047042 TaxID=3154807 RepID=UPI0033FB0152
MVRAEHPHSHERHAATVTSWTASRTSWSMSLEAASTSARTTASIRADTVHTSSVFSNSHA